MDDSEQLSVNRHVGDGLSIGRIDPTVTDVGWDDRRMVAKVQPEGHPGTPPSYY